MKLEIKNIYIIYIIIKRTYAGQTKKQQQQKTKTSSSQLKIIIICKHTVPPLTKCHYRQNTRTNDPLVYWTRSRLTDWDKGSTVRSPQNIPPTAGGQAVPPGRRAGLFTLTVSFPGAKYRLQGKVGLTYGPKYYSSGVTYCKFIACGKWGEFTSARASLADSAWALVFIMKST